MATSVKAGKSMRYVATRFRVCTKTVLAACIENGVDYPRAMKRSQRGSGFRVLAVLLNTNRTMSSIGRQFGVTRQAIEAVKKAATEAGIVIPQRAIKQPFNGKGKK